jgi:predicted Zn-dependent peptidase
MKQKAFITIIAAMIFAGSAFAAWKMPPVHKLVLDNGMTILMVERHGSPTFHAHVGFKTGGIDEIPGKSGLAHMLEHMLFKGTQTVGTKDYAKEKVLLDKLDKLFLELDGLRRAGSDSPRVEALKKEIKLAQDAHHKLVVSEALAKLYNKNGGRGLNASTGNDITQYYINLPKNRLELWAWLESDRMRSPVFREFYRERDVIAEERRMRIEADPGGQVWEALWQTAYAAHPYHIPVIGYMSDIQNFRAADLREHYRLNYAPNRTTVTVVGDFKHEEVFDICRKYFGDLKRQPDSPNLRPVEPQQKGERRVEIIFDAEPQVMIGYHIPQIGHEDLPALEVLSQMLSEGRTSRLFRSLVREKQVALSAGCFAMDSRDPGLFIFMGAPRHPHTVAEVESAIYGEIDLIINMPIPGREMLKIKNNFEADFIRDLGSNSGMARALGHYAVVYDYQYLETLLTAVQATTQADIKRVAKKYLKQSNRTVVVLRKAEEAS